MTLLDELRVAGAPRPAATQRPAPAPGERYLGGRIPMGWLTRAACLPGRALHLAVFIQFLAGLHRSARVRLNLSRLRPFGAPRTTAARALHTLEQAGLVSVERHPGRAPIVTILAVSPPSTEAP